ncbi:MAG: pentapeptide repeat-containing protein [Candidatus Nomurabacteria bacterium]|nr:MAG: pentapeptide repeat-containing protein [Candidatus Nomurabacteria bacterium]
MEILKGEDYSRETFEGISLSALDARDVTFSDCVFRKCRFDKANFSGASFNDCVFENCELSSPDFYRTTLYGVKFDGGKVVGANFSKSNSKFWTSPLSNALFQHVIFLR